MSRLKISGVVILYNPDEDYIDNINSYIDNIDLLYVIDNSDKKHRVPKSKKIKYIFNGDNLGISKTLNMAAKLSIKDGYKWMLTMDQDSKFEDNSMLEMKKYIENNDTSKDGIVTIWHDTKLDEKKPNISIDYPLVEMTSGNLVNLEIYDKIHGYNELYFIDGIDMDYCLKLKKNSYRIVRLNNVQMCHNLGDIKYHNLFCKRFLSSNHNYIRNYYIARNYRYIKDEYKDVAPEYCSVLTHLKLRIFTIILFERDKCRKIRNIFRGVRDYKKGVTGKYKYKN